LIASTPAEDCAEDLVADPSRQVQLAASALVSFRPMVSRHSVRGCALALALATAGQAGAAASNPWIDQARGELLDLEEEAALRSLARARAQVDNSPEELALVHLYEGLAHAGLANQAAALASFEAACLLAPALALPDWAGPQVRNWWAAAKTCRTLPAPVAVAPLQPPVGSTATYAAGPPRWPAWALGGVAIIAGSVGAGLATASAVNSSRAGEARVALETQRLDARAREQALAAHYWLGGAALAGGVAAVLLIRFD
jgi:hypothetical protein